MNTVSADIHPDGQHMYVTFKFDYECVKAIKSVPGRRFVPPDKGGPYWKMPLTWDVAQALGRACGDDLELSQELKEWGWSQRRKVEELGALGVASSADLEILPDRLPHLYRALYVGPLGKGKTFEELGEMMKDMDEGSFQTAGTKFVATADNPLLGDQPGLGKTLQAIGAVFEAQADNGPNLVIAPVTSLDTVWKAELEMWQDHPVYVAPEGRKAREEMLDRFFVEIVSAGKPGWLVVNPQMVAYRRVKDGIDPVTGEENILELPSYDGLLNVEWSSIILDEAHKYVSNPKTLTAKAIFKLKATGKKIAATGTPIPNKPINLWGQLHYLHPKPFSSKWRWAYQWLVVEDNGFGKTIGDLKFREELKRDEERGKRMQAEFYEAHAPYMLRRLKSECLPWLPPKQWVHRWAEMTPKQAKQYKEFAKNAEIDVSGTSLAVTGTLDEGIRLKQFATALCVMNDKGELTPTTESGKVQVLEEILEERAIFDGSEEKVVIFSQYERVIKMLEGWLASKKVETMTITGSVSRKRRTEIQDIFQADGGPQVLLMTTTAGGVAITLDRADTCVFMDETYLPSDQEQAEDRLHRASRNHNVTVIYIRTKGTVEEDIMNDVQDKADQHTVALAIRDHLKKMKEAA